MALTADEIKIAQDTIDKWFWQPVDGKFFRYKYAVKNLVRYYECAPVAADTLRIIIEYLRTEEVPVGGKISLLNKQVGGFDGWKAQDAWYQTAASDQWEGTKSDKIRIFQTLIGHDDESEGDGPYAVENGCRYKVTHTFYWNTEALPELPDSSSGVNYTMQGVTRDRETGLYSCVIECRERQQQDIGLYDSVKTQFEKRQIEQHLGVKANNVESTGEAASVENGVITERRLTKNEDCTTDIENVVTTEESVSEAVVEYRKTLRGTVTTILDRNQPDALDESGMEVGETRRSEKTPGKRFNNTTVKSAKEAAGIIARSCTKTQFEHEHQTVENVASEPSESSDLSASSASGGRIHTRTIRKTEENTFDITDTVRTEESVSEAVVEYRKTLRGTVTTILDRNQPDALDESGMEVGETRRSEKTPGKRFNNTTVKSAKEAAGIIARSCTKTQFEHEHQTVENVASEPSESSASSAAEGRIHTRTIRKTEENTFDITDTLRTEESVSEAVVEYRKTLRGTVTTILDRNQPDPLDESGMEVGETRRSEKTPGKRFNNTTVKSAKEAAGIIARSCTKTQFEHEHQTVENVASEPSESSTASASGGRIHTRTTRKTEENTFDITDTVRTEESVSEAVVEFRKTLRGTVTTILDRNQPDPLDESGMEVGETRRSEKTPGKRFNNTTVKSAKEAAGIIARSCTKTQFEHEHQTVENVASEPSESSDLSASSASGGRIHTRTIRKTEENTFDITDTVRTEESVSEAVVEFRKTPRSIYKTVVDRNQPDALDESGMEVGEIRRSEKTPGRRYNNTVTNRIRTIAGTIATMCLKAGGGGMHQHQSVEMVDSEPDSSAAGAACNYQRQRVVRKTDEGYQVENTVTQWNPESESESWSDDNYHYAYKSYINNPTVQKPTGDHDSVNLSFHQNGHGSFDGSWITRDSKASGAGSTLQWSVGPAAIEAVYHYFAKDGKLHARTVYGKVYRCGGKLSHVASEIQLRQCGKAGGDTSHYTGLPAVGWRTHVSGTVDHAYGEAYAVTSWGADDIVDDSNGGSSND